MAEEFLESITKEEAEKILEERFMKKPDSEVIKIEDAYGRVLSKDYILEESLPPFTKSTMDGYAIKASTTFTMSESSPLFLECVAEVEMGEMPTFSLSPFTCCRIHTGAALPEGADAVVMSEDTEDVGGRKIWIKKRVAPFTNVIREGEEAKKGAVILKKGESLSSIKIALLAAIGRREVEVYKKLSISIIPTGNEIIEPGRRREGAKIYDTNSFMLYTFLLGFGFNVKRREIVEDEVSALVSSIDEALNEDVVVVIGGSSIGTRDILKDALVKIGADILFHGIAMKPGRPTLFAKKDERLIVGLPGNPTSSAIVLWTVLLPQLLRIQGKRTWRPKKMNAILKSNVFSQKGRKEYIKGKLIHEGERMYVEPIFGASALLLPLLDTDVLIEIPEEWEGAEAGENVEVLLLWERDI